MTENKTCTIKPSHIMEVYELMNILKIKQISNDEFDRRFSVLEETMKQDKFPEIDNYSLENSLNNVTLNTYVHFVSIYDMIVKRRIMIIIHSNDDPHV